MSAEKHDVADEEYRIGQHEKYAHQWAPAATVELVGQVTNIDDAISLEAVPCLQEKVNAEDIDSDDVAEADCSSIQPDLLDRAGRTNEGNADVQLDDVARSDVPRHPALGGGLRRQVPLLEGRVGELAPVIGRVHN